MMHVAIAKLLVRLTYEYIWKKLEKQLKFCLRFKDDDDYDDDDDYNGKYQQRKCFSQTSIALPELNCLANIY